MEDFSGSYVTVAFSVARLTCASTPSILFNTFSTLLEQAEQVMPVTPIVTCFFSLINASSLFGKLFHDRHQFFHRFISIVGLDRIYHTMLHMSLRHFKSDFFQRSIDCTDLNQYIDTITVFFDHFLEASYLSFNPLQTVDDCFLFIFRSRCCWMFPH